MTVTPPHTDQCDGHEHEKQGQVVKDQHPLLADESLHCLKRVAAAWPGLTSDPLDMVVAQIHGVDVMDHVGRPEHSKAIDQPVTDPISVVCMQTKDNRIGKVHM